MRVIEFFSGIGGWRCALERLEQDITVVEAFDINTVANQVYHHNFSSKPNPKCINSLTKRVLDKLGADMWCMSPPCQPFTRSNTTSRRDVDDQRSAAFLHLTQLLRDVDRRPSYIALENVVGFETSDCCNRFLDTLTHLEYSYVQLILSPTQFGIPNSRPRYYLLACLTDIAFPNSSLWLQASSLSTLEQFDEGENKGSTRPSLLDSIPPLNAASKTACCPLRRICEYLEPTNFDDREFLIPKSILEKSSSWCFDIVSPDDNHSACFTKAYSRYARGTGSVLTTSHWMSSTPGTENHNADDSDSPKKRLRLMTEYDAQENAESGNTKECTQNTKATEEGKKCLSFEQINTLRLRYFTPRELLHIFGFPRTSFCIPSGVTNRKAYELIGNSLNVDVATHILRFLFENTGACRVNGI